MANKAATAARMKSGVREREKLTGSLTRGLAIIEALQAALRPLTLGEVAAQVGLDQSTVLRLLRTLEDSGYVLRIGGGKKYLPSPKAIRPLPLNHPFEQFRREAMPIVSSLATILSQTALLVVFVGHERMMINSVHRERSLIPYRTAWMDSPLHTSGSGKALLLGFTREKQRELLGPEPYRKLTPHTMTTFKELDADFIKSTERGYAASIGEQNEGLTSIGAIIRTWTGAPMGCLVITAHTREFSGDRMMQAAEATAHAAKLIPLQSAALSAVAEFCESAQVAS